jgi:hypothetical protein
MEKDTRPILEYYTRHSVITDPGKYASLFDDLPYGIQSFVKIVQGLLVSLPWEDAYNLDITWISLERDTEKSI